jgi:hypothetical protein
LSPRERDRLGRHQQLREHELDRMAGVRIGRASIELIFRR